MVGILAWNSVVLGLVYYFTFTEKSEVTVHTFYTSAQVCVLNVLYYQGTFFQIPIKGEAKKVLELFGKG